MLPESLGVPVLSSVTVVASVRVEEIADVGASVGDGVTVKSESSSQNIGGESCAVASSGASNACALKVAELGSCKPPTVDRWKSASLFPKSVEWKG
jgi:hypothetical protein